VSEIHRAGKQFRRTSAVEFAMPSKKTGLPAEIGFFDHEYIRVPRYLNPGWPKKWILSG
jgi:hypothetical protein